MKQLDSYSCNTEKYQRELEGLYDCEIKPTLDYARSVLDQSNCQTISPGAIKHLTEKPQNFNDKLKDMLEKIESEERKVKESKTGAKFVGLSSVCIFVVAATMIVLIHPTGVAFASYLVAVVFSVGAVVVSYYGNGKVDSRAAGLKEMIVKINQYKGETSTMSTRLDNVVIEFTRQYEIAHSHRHSPPQAQQPAGNERHQRPN